MSDDNRKWAVDLYDGETFIRTVLVEGPGARVEDRAVYRETFKFTKYDSDHRRAKAVLDKVERES